MTATRWFMRGNVQSFIDEVVNEWAVRERYAFEAANDEIEGAWEAMEAAQRVANLLRDCKRPFRTVVIVQ